MDIRENEPLARYTTIGLGGRARYFASVSSIKELKKALSFAKENKLSFFLLGKGSNTLFDDRGYSGLVILNRLNQCTITDEIVVVDSGYSFANLGMKTAKRGLSGLEFASGIPGSVGGAVFMNAGACGSSTWDVLDRVTFIDENMNLKMEPSINLPAAYRYSFFQDTKCIIVSASFKLTKNINAKNTLKTLLDYRMQSQPYGDKSAGCVFKNPDGQSAGALIDACGLKGTTVGGAKVSEVHANFIVTEKGASAKDIYLLVELIKNEVTEKKNIVLKQEVCIVPFES